MDKVTAYINDVITRSCLDNARLEIAKATAVGIYDAITKEFATSIRTKSETITAAFTSADEAAVDLIALAEQYDALLYDPVGGCLYFQPAHQYAKKFFLAIVILKVYDNLKQK